MFSMFLPYFTVRELCTALGYRLGKVVLGKQDWAFNSFSSWKSSSETAAWPLYVVSAIKGCSCSTFFVSVTQIKAAMALPEGGEQAARSLPHADN